MKCTRLFCALGATLLIAGTAEAQDQRNEQFYFPGSFNWQFLKQYPEGGRLFNAFDYGHAILYEQLLTRPAQLERELEQRQFDYLTTDLLVRPPRFAVAEEAIEPAYSKLAWRAKRMFDWAHVLHRQIYDIYADPRLTPAQRDRLIERVTDYYLSNRRLAFTSQPKSMTLMDDQYYSQVFRRDYPKFNGLIWAYHWLQVGLYEPLIEGQTPGEKKAGVQATIARFWSMIEEPPTRFPKVMPMTSAVAPLFSAAHPRAAVIFDNLHMTHDIISDILASDTVPAARKREVIYAALDQMQDPSRDVMTMDEWRNMGEMMGGVGIMGGPATGILPEVPTLGGAAPAAPMAGMHHGAMDMGAGGGARADSAAVAPVRPGHPMAQRADSMADPADSMADRPGMDHQGDSMMAAMMQLHQRMLADSVIRGRVQAVAPMRQMMERMREMMGANRPDSLPRMMNQAPADTAAADPHAGHRPSAPAKPTRRRPPPAPGSAAAADSAQPSPHPHH